MTEDNEPIDGMLEEAFKGDGIFTDDEATDGMKAAAESLGIDPETADIKKPQSLFYAKKNCKHCFGLGVIAFVASPAKPKTIVVSPTSEFEKSQRKRRRFKKNGVVYRKPTPKRRRCTVDLEGNKLGQVWNTCQPEPDELKDRLVEYMPCRCVRLLEL